VKYVVRRESIFPYILLTIQSSAILFLYPWQKVSTLVGKKNAYYMGAFVFFGVTISAYFVDSYTRTLWLFMLAFVAGIGVSAGIKFFLQSLNVMNE
jgi:Na+/melibiose symporter-like transporter